MCMRAGHQSITSHNLVHLQMTCNLLRMEFAIMNYEEKVSNSGHQSMQRGIVSTQLDLAQQLDFNLFGFFPLHRKGHMTIL